ncbi:PREDICTED: solute carrier family 22 member 6-like [Rhagoletis zephyria]|uniref:solute carrier family 22 member 6-like n=1 Tax=Rhagoletis zephyria TaxID=28612 RepID=UPI0008115713|nr:PREDICTED: solute carrier family 22 member 6-like [Rhagoletis zephyria]
MLELDKILEKCGDCHRLQAIMLLLFCIINLLSALHYYSQTIISFVPKYWCLDGYTDPMDAYAEASKQSDSSCHPHRLAAEDDDLAPTNFSAVCQHFDYELYMGYQSFTSELNWICDRAWQATLGQSMFFVGSVVGSLLFGFLADSLGRLPILIVANIVAMVGNSLTVFGTTLPTFSLFRFLSGMATDSNFVMMYILGSKTRPCSYIAAATSVTLSQLLVYPSDPFEIDESIMLWKEHVGVEISLS